MSILNEKDKDTIEATEDLTPEGNDSRDEMTPDTPTSEPLTLEDLELDVSEPSMTFTATLHFEFSDIFNAIEHINQMPETTESEEPEPVEAEPELEAESAEAEPEPVETELEPETENEETPAAEHEPEVEVEQDSAADIEPESELEPEPESEQKEEPEPAETPEIATAEETATESNQEPDPAAEQPEQSLMAKLKNQDAGTKKLVMTVGILFLVIAISVIVGLTAANSLVDNAKAANEQKIAEMQANIKEVKLTDSLYNMAANQVIEDIAVPTYSLDELYALDLREKTGFTANDLKKITRKGLVGCEEAFVKAEQTYGVNSIFLISIASLESAHGTMMFRPNNMFGYGRTGFSSKEECIMTVAKGLGTRYLPPGGSLYGGSPTLKGVNKRYAANPQWYYKVGKYMQGYYAELAAEKNGALDKFE